MHLLLHRKLGGLYLMKPVHFLLYAVYRYWYRTLLKAKYHCPYIILPFDALLVLNRIKRAIFILVIFLEAIVGVHTRTSRMVFFSLDCHLHFSPAISAFIYSLLSPSHIYMCVLRSVYYTPTYSILIVEHNRNKHLCV